MKTIILLLTCLTLPIFTCSLSGQVPTGDPVPVPVGHIKEANRLYLERERQLQTLVSIDSLRQKQITSLNLMLLNCRQENSINEKIIHAHKGQIGRQEEIIKNLRITNRILISISIAAITYSLLQ